MLPLSTVPVDHVILFVRHMVCLPRRRQRGEGYIWFGEKKKRI